MVNKIAVTDFFFVHWPIVIVIHLLEIETIKKKPESTFRACEKNRTSGHTNGHYRHKINVS